ncbi:hypothetical protein PMAYCL1PPCAC_24802, partial [Pristionchus mayeri]
VDKVDMSRTLPDGIIRFEADKDNEERVTHEINLRGVPWKVVLVTNDLSVILNCTHKQITPWRADFDADFTIVNSDNNRKNLTHKERSYAERDHNRTFVDLDAWWNPIEEEEGYIDDGKITIEVRFWVRSMK